MMDRRWLVGAALATAAVVRPGSLLAAGGVAPAEEVAEPQYIRLAEEEGRSLALEIAVRDFHSAEPGRPVVRLVGVAHIGDASYYETIQELLDAEPLVLYESVKPAGTGGAGGDTDDERTESTRAAMQFTASLIEHHHVRHERYPADLEALGEFARGEDPRHASLLDVAVIDAWGHRLHYERTERGYTLASHGADGKEGGVGPDADIELETPVEPLAVANEDNLQAQLAEALALSFQLTALDYDRPHWQCSDMAIDQVSRAMEERGSDFSLLEGTLAGTSLTAQLTKVLLGLIRFADAFLDGAVSDAIKVVLMELLGDEKMIELTLTQFDEAFTEVIIGDRNQVVIDDLEQVLKHEPDLESVAILYGAGHMTDMATRLSDQLGYRPGGARWLRAIEIDLTATSVPESDLRRLRLMVRRMLRQMSVMGKRGR